MDLKAAVKDCTPPILLRQLRKVRRLWHHGGSPPLEPPEWEYVPQGWSVEGPAVRGWDQSGVAETYASRWQRFLELIEGTQPPAADHEVLHGPAGDSVDTQNQVMTLAYVVGRLARGRDRLAILDYGGALGHHLAFLRVLFPELAFDYFCRETPHVAEQGRKLHPEVHFVTDDSWTERTFQLVFASNSFQYACEWEKTLAQLAQAAESAVFLTKLPVVQYASSYVFIQRAEKYGYRTEYLAWCHNQAEFLASARKRGLILEREFLVWRSEPTVAQAPEKLRHKGFLFRKQA